MTLTLVTLLLRGVATHRGLSNGGRRGARPSPFEFSLPIKLFRIYEK
jgi:hypothetical protein